MCFLAFSFPWLIWGYLRFWYSEGLALLGEATILVGCSILPPFPPSFCSLCKMHQWPNSLSMMWERSVMTDLLMSMAVFLRELYVLYVALVFHSRVSKLKDLC